MFLSNAEGIESSKKVRVAAFDPKDLSMLAFESYLSNVRKNRDLSITDALEAENPMKIIAGSFVKNQKE